MLVAKLILIFGFLSFGVWIYQAIILPSVRQRLRFELFCLRDQTRRLVIEGQVKEDSAAFRYLHRQLNVMIKAIPRFDFALIYAIEDNDPELKARAEKSRKLIEESNFEIQKIYNKAIRIMALVLVANSFIWFLCFSVTTLPVVLSEGVWKLLEVVRNRLRMKVQPAFGLRDRDLALGL